MTLPNLAELIALRNKIGNAGDWLGGELRKLGLDSNRINAEAEALGFACADALFDGNCEPRQIAEARLAKIKIEPQK